MNSCRELALKGEYDSCVYYKRVNDAGFVYLLLYVDDMLIAIVRISRKLASSKKVLEVNLT